MASTKSVLAKGVGDCTGYTTALVVTGYPLVGTPEYSDERGLSHQRVHGCCPAKARWAIMNGHAKRHMLWLPEPKYKEEL